MTLPETAAFELDVRASTPWADAFTLDEWVAYGYIWDLAYYYCFGYVCPDFFSRFHD